MLKTRFAILIALAIAGAWYATERDIETACAGNARCIAASL